MKITSPDAQKAIFLDYDGEARFGPAFFTARAVGFDWPLGNATVGEDVAWSPDSRFVILVQYHSRDTSKAPDVELLAIDTHGGRTISISRNSQGLIQPKGFNSAMEYEYLVVVNGLETTKRWSLPV